jgi:Tat protein translocase TatB subunit
MFGIGMPELLVIVVIALIVVGPKKLPDLAKALGKGMSEFRKAADGATETIKETLKTDELKRDMDGIKESLLHGIVEGKKNSETDAASEEAKKNPPDQDESKPHA